MHGGEHSLLGYSTFDAGIVLDLSLVRSVRAASPKRTAQAQAGLCWGELDPVTEPQAGPHWRSGLTHRNCCPHAARWYRLASAAI